jgi:peptidoglycan hydrolase-like protein with peptidoglycan-binding domain
MAYPGLPPRDGLRPFARSDRVARLQSGMIAQGVYTGPVDGVMNERTRSGIRAWQGRLGDPRTGMLTQIEVVRLLKDGGGAA